MMIEQGSSYALKLFYDGNSLDLTFDDFAKALKDWALFVLRDPDPVAVIAVKDGHGHIASVNGCRVGIIRMREALNMLHITNTTVSNHYAKGHSLARRLGFKKHHTDKVTHYVLDPQ